MKIKNILLACSVVTTIPVVCLISCSKENIQKIECKYDGILNEIVSQPFQINDKDTYIFEVDYSIVPTSILEQPLFRFNTNQPVDLEFKDVKLEFKDQIAGNFSQLDTSNYTIIPGSTSSLVDAIIQINPDYVKEHPTDLNWSSIIKLTTKFSKSVKGSWSLECN